MGDLEIETLIKRLWWVYIAHLLGRHQLEFEDFRDLLLKEFK